MPGLQVDNIYARNGAAVTPHDTNDNKFAFIYIGVGGTVVLSLAGATTTFLTLVSVPSGTFLPLQTAVIKSTGTTATNLVGFNLGR